MGKRGGAFLIIIGVLLVVFLVAGMFFYFALKGPDYTNEYEELEKSGGLNNPAAGKSLEEAKEEFNEDFIFYMLYSIKAYNLKTPPLSSDTPKMEIVVGEEVFNSEIRKGEILVEKGEISGEDVVIKTSKEEAVKMVQEQENIGQSFEEGKSTIELKASKSTLFAKGYLKLYTELTGKSITGNVARIYAG